MVHSAAILSEPSPSPMDGQQKKKETALQFATPMTGALPVLSEFNNKDQCAIWRIFGQSSCHRGLMLSSPYLPTRDHMGGQGVHKGGCVIETSAVHSRPPTLREAPCQRLLMLSFCLQQADPMHQIVLLPMGLGWVVTVTPGAETHQLTSLLYSWMN